MQNNYPLGNAQYAIPAQPIGANQAAFAFNNMRNGLGGMTGMNPSQVQQGSDQQQAELQKRILEQSLASAYQQRQSVPKFGMQRNY